MPDIIKLLMNWRWKMKNAMSNGAMTSMVAADRMRLMIYRIMLFAESFFRCGLQRLIPCGTSKSISIGIIFT